MGIDTEKLFSRIKDVLIKTCIAGEPYMMHMKTMENRTNCYEIYGFDILID